MKAERPERTPFPKGYWTIWSTVALDLIGFGIVVPILGVYAERFGASGYAVGWLFATFSLAQFMFAPLLGRLSDRIGRKPVIVISLIGTAIGSFVTGAAGALWVLFLGRFIDGASGASLSVAQAAVADMAEPASDPAWWACSVRRSGWASSLVRPSADWPRSAVRTCRSTWPVCWHPSTPWPPSSDCPRPSAPSPG